ncbi:retrovirus-related pol polyprotein from transposon TNT 1-94 [Tanacetum coccineum]
MASEVTFVQPSIPRFDGQYEHWSMLMENFLRSKEYWQAIEYGVETPDNIMALTNVQQQELQAMKLKDLKAKNYLFQAIDRSILEKILNKATMKPDEPVSDYFSRVMAIVNKMRIHGDKTEDVTVVEKILRSLTTKFNFVVCAIEESKDVDELSLDELQSSLMVHEQKFKQPDSEERALKVSTDHSMTSKMRWMRKIDEKKEEKEERRVEARKRRRQQGRGQRKKMGTPDKSSIECYRCHKFGHYSNKCRTNLGTTQGEEVNYAENEVPQDEILLLMASCEIEPTHKNVWYLDTGFWNLDTKVSVLGKGEATVVTEHNVTHNMSSVLYVPDLKTNLLSIGQLQEKGYEISIKKGVCKILHDEFGIGYGLKTLQQKAMVAGLPHFSSSSYVCEECTLSKQHREPFPKGKTQRARKLLEMVHSDICGPIDPTSNGEQGIKRQLTAAYTPQQNGVSERKNRTILNMVRSLMQHSKVPKNFRPEAVNWSIHILNRSPTFAFQNMTPEEAWSGKKPDVSHFRVFGCIAYARVPDQKRKKLDDKGEKCILLGVSDCSKAFKLYNPNTKKIIISRDVIFDEDNVWQWDKPHTQQQVPTDLDGGSSHHHDEYFVQPQVVESTAIEESAIPIRDTRSSRVRRRPAWMNDFEVTGVEQSEDPLVHFVLFADCDPVVFEEAVKEPKWQKAMDEEIAAIERNKTWELVDLPKGQKVIDVKWVYKTKLKRNGEVDKYKARLVAKGYKQEYGVDYKEVFSPVARHDTIRLVIALAAQNSWPVFHLDVKSAFLHGELKEQFKKSVMAEFDMSDLGRLHYFLGIEVVQSDAGIFISQRKYMQEILKKFRMKDCNPVSTPVEPGVKLVKDENGRDVDSTLYKQIVGSLIYLTATRPDIMYVVNLVCRFMESPKEVHLQAAKRIMRYLQGTLDYGIMYKRGEDSELIGFTDGDYAGDLDDGKSTSGYAFMIGSGAISWSSRKQPIVTLSTTEAELVAATACGCQAIWLRYILEELNFSQGEPIIIFCDNNSSIKLSRDRVLHGRSKHISVRCHFLRDRTRSQELELVYCRSEDQVADILTKALKPAVFQKLRRMLGVCKI